MCIGLAASPSYQSCTGCCGCIPVHRKGSLWRYFALMLVATALALLLRFNFSDSLTALFYESFHDCATCVGYASVFRISFATFAFYLTHALLLCFPLCWLVDSYSWVLKVLYWFALIVLAFLLPEPFYRDFYVHVSRVIGGVFLLLQVVILVDFAHALNEKWNNQPAEKERMYKALILGVSLLLLLASLAVLILLFVWWDSCGLHKFFIGMTLAGTFLICVLCVTEKFSERGGILPAAVITLYCYWLCYSGINSDPRECNHRSTQGVAQLVIGLIVAAGSIAYAGWNVGTHEDLFGTEEAAAAKAQEERADMEAAAGGGSELDREAAHAQVLQLESADSSSEVGMVARQNFRFHLVFAACSMYMAMVRCTFRLLTNWGSVSAAEDMEFSDGNLQGRAYDLSAESMWIKFASQWLTMILFTWSVIAPVVLKGRDFS